MNKILVIVSVFNPIQPTVPLEGRYVNNYINIKIIDT